MATMYRIGLKATQVNNNAFVKQYCRSVGSATFDVKGSDYTLGFGYEDTNVDRFSGDYPTDGITIHAEDEEGETAANLDDSTLYGDKPPYLYYYETEYVANNGFAYPTIATDPTTQIGTYFKRIGGTFAPSADYPSSFKKNRCTFTIPEELLGIHDGKINVFIVNPLSFALAKVDPGQTEPEITFTNNATGFTITGVEFNKGYKASETPKVHIGYTLPPKYIFTTDPTVSYGTTTLVIPSQGLDIDLTQFTESTTITVNGVAVADTPNFGFCAVYAPSKKALTELTNNVYAVVSDGQTTTIDYSSYVIKSYVCFGDLEPITDTALANIILGSKDTTVQALTINDTSAEFDLGQVTVPDTAVKCRLFLPFVGFTDIELCPRDMVSIKYRFSTMNGNGGYSVFVNGCLVDYIEAFNGYSLPYRVTGTSVATLDINGLSLDNRRAFLEVGSQSNSFRGDGNAYVKGISATKDELDELQQLIERGITL